VVVVKRLKNNNPKHRTLFENEWQTGRNLNHENVVRYNAFYSNDEIIDIELEYVNDSKSLAEWLIEKELKSEEQVMCKVKLNLNEEFLRYLFKEQIIRAVNYCHS